MQLGSLSTFRVPLIPSDFVGYCPNVAVLRLVKFGLPEFFPLSCSLSFSIALTVELHRFLRYLYV